VCGLHKEFSQQELEKMFNAFGTIISSKILTDSKTGISKGVGFVRFDQRIEAEVAISKLNGKAHEASPDPLIVKFANSPTSVKSVMGLPLAPFVPTCRGFFQPYRSSANSSYRYSPMSAPYCPDVTLLHQQNGLNNLIAQHQHQHHQQQQQQQITPNLQNVLSNSLPIPPISAGGTMVSTGGVLQIASQQQQQQQQQPPPPTSLSNTSLSSINYSGWCIFVYNLGPDTDDHILWQLFGPFGAVQSVKIIRDVQSQKCKGFGFITMTNYEEAVTAINCLNGLNLQNRILQVSFKTNNKQLF
jgi:ELAV like protein 2/3/4